MAASPKNNQGGVVSAAAPPGVLSFFFYEVFFLLLTIAVIALAVQDLPAAAEYIRKTFAHVPLLVLFLIFFAAQGTFMGKQHRLISGKDRFTGKGLDLPDACYLHKTDKIWGEHDFTKWAKEMKTETLLEYHHHNQVAFVNVLQLNCVFVSIYALVMPELKPGPKQFSTFGLKPEEELHDPFWWFLVWPLVPLLAKAMEAFCIDCLLAYHLQIVRFRIVSQVAGPIAGVCCQIKLYGTVANFAMAFFAVVYHLKLFKRIDIFLPLLFLSFAVYMFK